MKTTRTEGRKSRTAFMVLGGAGAVFGIWAITAFTSLLAQLDWNVAEVLRQYMVATGALNEQETLVDYYTHIKGAEYIIAVAFLGLYPVFYKYVNRTKVSLKA
ncbi:MAG: hypothetical protein ACYDBT_17405 [Desulfobulbaceae bacterium]